MTYQKLLDLITETDKFIAEYERMLCIDSETIYVKVNFYMVMYIRDACKVDNMDIVKYILDKSDKTDNGRYALLYYILGDIRDLHHIRFILNYLQPNKKIIKKLIHDYIYRYEQHVEYYLCEYWNRKPLGDINNLLENIDLLMNIHKPPRIIYTTYGFIGKLIICRYYEKSENDYNNYIIQWTTKLIYGLIKLVPNKDMLLLLKNTNDFHMEFFGASKVIIPKTHSLYEKYIKYHTPKITYMKKIWEIIGLRMSTDIIA